MEMLPVADICVCVCVDGKIINMNVGDIVLKIKKTILTQEH